MALALLEAYFKRRWTSSGEGDSWKCTGQNQEHTGQNLNSKKRKMSPKNGVAHAPLEYGAIHKMVDQQREA